MVYFRLMSIPEAEHHLFSSSSPLQAYERMDLKHYDRARTMEEILGASPQEISTIGSDYFTTGVAFFANRSSDPHFEEMGTQTWRTVNQGRVNVVFSTSPTRAALRLGATSEMIEGVSDEEPLVMVAGHKTDPSQDFGLVFITPELIVDAKNNPVDALARMAFICSQLYDMANGRHRIDPDEIDRRAYATEAQFLLDTIRDHPGVELNSTSARILEDHPLGLQSLPPAARYWELYQQ